MCPSSIGRSATCLDRDFAYSVTITQRLGFTPQDRIDTAVLVKATTGMMDLVEALMVAMNLDYDIIQYVGGSYGAATYTGGKSYSLAVTVEGFATPPKLLRASKPVEKGVDWFFSERQAKPDSGVAVQIDFGNARRIQRIGG